MVQSVAEIISNGHPPEADKVILVDFDNTLYPFGYMFNAPKPLEGAVAFMQELRARGYTIGIFTSRVSKYWIEKANQDEGRHRKYIGEICERDGIPFDFITADKVPAECYIDDKAIAFRNNWGELYEQFFNKT